MQGGTGGSRGEELVVVESVVAARGVGQWWKV